MLQNPEVYLLKKLKHPNVIELYEIIKENNDYYLILEYLDTTLYDYLQDYKQKG